MAQAAEAEGELATLVSDASEVASRAVVFEGNVDLPLGPYVVSVRGRAEGWAIAQRDPFLAKRSVGDTFPSAKLFDARCSICFESAASVQVRDGMSATSSGSSSDS